ncbi:C1 family peptidase [Prevotella sp. E9-3]|uniref:C1 family peptidase n=1 Tax=Prevotella sp. E9-3 TaxID=2913621 RepID=UPI001EDAA000|nr:C1 family peptidase [Prevotella sp. E9-3]UKK47798.1 C1 family peptidase [Prevotella sp. E9-3]
MKYFLCLLMLIPQVLLAQYTEKCFIMGNKGEAVSVPVGLLTSQDTTQLLCVDDFVYGLSVSGTATLNSENSYVRILLRDEYDYDYMVYENYPLLTKTGTSSFQNVCIETLSLEKIRPKELIVTVRGATIKIDSLFYLRHRGESKIGIERLQAQAIIDKLNVNLNARNMTWRAGHTSLSQMSYEEKKNLFGGKVPELYGFDYYIGGIFAIPSVENSTIQVDSEERSLYVDNWDWRNRHGKNWMTSVKNQGNCGSCWAFSAIGALEAYVNLYYNKQLNMNLSEQQLVSCIYSNGCSGGNRGVALNYIKNNGVVNEGCFPYTATNSDCSNKCDSPDEEVFLGNYGSLSFNEDSIKKKLFVAPVTFGISDWGHALVLVGYKTIEVGDYIYIRSSDETVWVQINSTDHSYLIGKTVWILKNSWGTSWGDNGYAYVYVNAANLNTPYYLKGNITTMSYTDSDVVCEDADGDGYYFWGIGSKPSFCPSWVPDIPDGNDASYTQGAMNQYGVLESLNPNQSPALIINGTQTYTTQQSQYSHINIKPNATLIVRNVLNMFGRTTITVENGGKLIIDGGVITNAYIQLQSGSQLQLLNGGIIVIRTNSVFSTPVGSVVNATFGKICNSSDFSSF